MSTCLYATNGPVEKVCTQNWVEPLGFPHRSDPKIQIRRREVCGRTFLLWICQTPMRIFWCVVAVSFKGKALWRREIIIYLISLFSPRCRPRPPFAMATTTTTVFGPALETMKTVKSPDGEMLTKPFLNVCRNVLPVIGNWFFQESSSSFCLLLWLLSWNLFLFLFFFSPCFVLFWFWIMSMPPILFTSCLERFSVGRFWSERTERWGKKEE